MKTLLQSANKRKVRKFDVQSAGGKTWVFPIDSSSKSFKRDDKSTGVDKTKGFKSRPIAKTTLRNANRAIQKRGRTALKHRMMAELNDYA